MLIPVNQLDAGVGRSTALVLVWCLVRCLSRLAVGAVGAWASKEACERMIRRGKCRVRSSYPGEESIWSRIYLCSFVYLLFWRDRT